MNRRFAFLIIAAMVLGVLVGWACNQYLDPAQTAEAVKWFKMGTDLFLRLIKMIIAPLVFTTLVAGIAHMEDAAAVGRIGAKTMGWFISASAVSLLLGLLMVHLLHPGAGLVLNEATNVAANAPAASTETFTLQGFLTHLVPTSIFDALAKNEILQIVVFSLFVGTAVASLDNKAPHIMELAEQGAQIMLKVTGFVMKLAPLAIFCALASTIADQGISMLLVYGKFVIGFYATMATLWVLLFIAAFVVLGKRALPLFGDDPRAGPAGLLDRQLGGRLSAHPRRPAQAGHPPPHRLVRPAAGLFVQSRRLDAVLHLRHHVHPAGPRRAPDASSSRSSCCCC
jgi:Na+/H+-dicarboxylate symporter